MWGNGLKLHQVKVTRLQGYLVSGNDSSLSGCSVAGTCNQEKVAAATRLNLSVQPFGQCSWFMWFNFDVVLCGVRKDILVGTFQMEMFYGSMVNFVVEWNFVHWSNLAAV